MDTNPKFESDESFKSVGSGKVDRVCWAKDPGLFGSSCVALPPKACKASQVEPKRGPATRQAHCSCGCSSGVRGGIIEAIPPGDVGNVGASCVGHGHVADI